jgi:hypothetical protein
VRGVGCVGCMGCMGFVGCVRGEGERFGGRRSDCKY